MSADVLFIIHDVYQDDNQFPLGIGYLASVLREQGYGVEVYCMDVYHYTNEMLGDKLDANEYKLICIGFMASRFKETILDLCSVVNAHKKDAWLVLGGHGSSPIPKYMIEKTNADVVSIGESENTLLKILHDKKHYINARIYRCYPVENLDVLPFPAWDLFPMDKYIRSIQFKGMDEKDCMFQMISARGCINACTFCYRMEKGIRLRSIDRVIDEMMYLYEHYKVSTIRFQDEMFLVSKKRLMEFIDKLTATGMDMKFYIDARVDFFDREIAQMLKNHGCIGIDFGFESSSQAVLNEIKKNATVEKNIKVLELAKEVDIPVGLNFIWGYPSDDEQTLRNNADLITRYNHYQSLRTIRPVTAYPGCELYYEGIQKGLINGPDDFFNRFRNSDLITMNFTAFPDDVCYRWLYDVNKMLITDHYEHIDGDREERDYFIEQLGMLYAGKLDSFRGFRHYEKKAV